MKGNLTDHGIGVMLILRGPGGFRGGRVIDALVTHIDFYPTVCGLLRIGVRAGSRALPCCRSSGARWKSCTRPSSPRSPITRPTSPSGRPHQRWKYIRRFDHRLGPVLANCDDSPSKGADAHGWTERSRPWSNSTT